MSASGGTRVVVVQEALLSKNKVFSEQNRSMFDAEGCLVLNILSSPGAGKTTLLERTLADLAGTVRMGVIVGDLATDNDARRLQSSGAPVVQITTQDICHLDAAMVQRAVHELPRPLPEILFIENVGNLVCPASFDLGEHCRVALMSVTEGEDKPIKYPLLFSTADLVLVTKADIAAAAGFDRDLAMRNLMAAAPHADVIELSARTGDGMEMWYDWLRNRQRKRGTDGDTQRRGAGVP